MKITISITKKNIKPVIFWTVYILIFLFHVSLTLDSYKEYEDYAGNIFLVLTSVMGVGGMGLFIFRRRNTAPDKEV